MIKLKILIACEFTGIVRDAFARLGHNATSCDFLPSELPGNHIQANVMDLNLALFDMMVAFPPCTYLASSGARWWLTSEVEQRKAIFLFLFLIHAPIRHIAVENPIGKMSTRFRPPDQIIHPWQFGHGETKATCLWLKNLPPLTPTNIVAGRHPRIHLMPPSKDRGKERSRTYQGVADAMAHQWGALGRHQSSFTGLMSPPTGETSAEDSPNYRLPTRLGLLAGYHRHLTDPSYPA